MATFRKSSILRKTGGEGYQHPHGYGLTMQGMYSGEQAAEEATVTGTALAVAESSASSFRLKYAMIGHRYTFPIEQVFVENVQ